ncbi:Hypothetical predicted protein [Mytilus galloprovincialis]|uniref:NHR domain-containing protein n=2 Tax=Mytilus galloprovincialis TaxID=29158 RepID=A0A8B6GPN7_MYTGA|nr:Hypothetical predicted protein [Mytilus galloprovincialis]
MADRKSTTSNFSKICGQNVKVKADTAEWNISYSGGRLFTCQPITAGQTIVFNLFGSGHVEFGLFCKDPEELMNVSSIENQNEFKYLQTTRVHKIGGKIHVICSDDGSKVTFRRDNQECCSNIDVDKKTWITANLLFGNITAQIENPYMCFHRIKGENINLTETKSKANLKTINPSTVCYIPYRLRTNDQLQLHLTPVKFDGRPPSVYFVKMAVSEYDPEIFMNNLKPIHCLEDLPVTIIPPEVCSSEGDIHVEICDNKVITKQSSLPEVVANTGIDVSRGFYCLFELYRVKLSCLRIGPALESNISSQNIPSSNLNGLSLSNLTNGLDQEDSHRITRTKSESQKGKFDQIFDIIEALEKEHCDKLEIREDFECVKCRLSEIKNKLSSSSIIHTQITESEIAMKIRENYSQLLICIDPLTLSDHLFQENMISFDNHQHVRNKWQVDPTNAKRDLLAMLMVRKLDKHVLRKVFTNCKQEHVHDILFPENAM